MPRRTYSGDEIVRALGKWRFKPVPGGKGSHTKLRYINPDTGEKRTVIVPDHDELATGTLQEIAEQAGADDFQDFLNAIDDLV